MASRDLATERIMHDSSDLSSNSYIKRITVDGHGSRFLAKALR